MAGDWETDDEEDMDEFEEVIKVTEGSEEVVVVMEGSEEMIEATEGSEEMIEVTEVLKR